MKIKGKVFLISVAVIFIAGLLIYEVYGQFRLQEIQAQSLQEQDLLSKKNKNNREEKGKSKKNQQRQEKKEKNKNQNQPGEKNYKTNPAKAYSQNKEKMIDNLKQISQKQKQEQSKKVIQEIVEDEEQIKEEVEESIKKQEQRGGLKTLLWGADYKNLGQLRKALVQNRNQIRKLEKTLEMTTDEELQKQIKQQIKASQTEQQQLELFIKENEEQFSIFGWAFKLIYGYQDQGDLDQRDDIQDTNDRNMEKTDQKQ
ncbi:MAG: hypothetical protein GF335_04950 [Candidatus Moranbacteria bacterium]|nr:hypothetical protein [Candidatus Moranbacteria bacterium]